MHDEAWIPTLWLRESKAFLAVSNGKFALQLEMEWKDFT